MEAKPKPKSVRRQLFECREILRDTNKRNRALQEKLEEAQRQVVELREQLDEGKGAFEASDLENNRLQTKLNTAMGLLISGVGLLEAICPDDADWFEEVREFVRLNTTSTEGK